MVGTTWLCGSTPLLGWDVGGFEKLKMAGSTKDGCWGALGASGTALFAGAAYCAGPCDGPRDKSAISGASMV